MFDLDFLAGYSDSGGASGFRMGTRDDNEELYDLAEGPHPPHRTRWADWWTTRTSFEDPAIEAVIIRADIEHYVRDIERRLQAVANAKEKKLSDRATERARQERIKRHRANEKAKVTASGKKKRARIEPKRGPYSLNVASKQQLKASMSSWKDKPSVKAKTCYAVVDLDTSNYWSRRGWVSDIMNATWFETSEGATREANKHKNSVIEEVRHINGTRITDEQIPAPDQRCAECGVIIDSPDVAEFSEVRCGVPLCMKHLKEAAPKAKKKTLYYTAAECAELRCRTTQALAMERQRGEGPPYVRDGGRILYPADELQKWLDARRVRSEPAAADVRLVKSSSAPKTPAPALAPLPAPKPASLPVSPADAELEAMRKLAEAFDACPREARERVLSWFVRRCTAAAETVAAS